VTDIPDQSSDDEATVTVVVTTFNHAHYLHEALESAFRQTRPPDEVIVVDDGSTDNPDEVTALYPRVRLIRQKNQGLSAARNTGLSAASGTYVLFLDADDRLTPVALATHLDRFARNPGCAFVYAGYRVFGAVPGGPRDITLREPGRDPYARFLEGNQIGMHATVLYRRTILAAIGGFDRSLRACEDYDVYLRLTREHRVACGPEVVAEYRQHGSNMSGDLSLMLRSVEAVLEKQKEWASARPHWEEARRRGLRTWTTYYAAMALGKARAQHSTGVPTLKIVRRTMPMLVKAPGVMARIAVERGGRKSAAMARARFPKAFTWARTAVGRVRHAGFALRGTGPVSTNFGFERGRPIDRRYIETFLAANAEKIRGHVLEIGDTTYTKAHGGDRVTSAEAFHRQGDREGVVYWGDLSGEHNLPENRFDCIVFTQTLHLIFDMNTTIEALHRALRPGGTLLITVPWISPIDRGEWRESWYWAISQHALQRLLCGPFPTDGVEVDFYGNTLAASAFLYGFADHEVSPRQLEVKDPGSPVIVAAVASKAP
jgi:SAM-dependent methyltransferase